MLAHEGCLLDKGGHHAHVLETILCPRDYFLPLDRPDRQPTPLECYFVDGC
jgi:hypothetical protein